MLSLALNEPAPFEVHEMREHRAARGGHQPRIEPGIALATMSGIARGSLADQPQYLLLALHPVADQRADILLRVRHRRARAPDNRSGRRAARSLSRLRIYSAMSPSGGTTTVVDQPITWSPVNSAPP